MTTEGKSRLLTALRKVRYVGGHPNVPFEVPKVDVEFWGGGIAIRDRRQSIDVNLPWDQVVALRAESHHEIDERVTASRVLVLGALALLAKKQKVVSFLTVEDKLGEYYFAITGVHPRELGAGLQFLQRRIVGSPEIDAVTAELSTPSEDSIADRLSRLDRLREAGHLTDEEFAQARGAIIAEL